ncbi:hypothetical protein M430DRAFT_173729 [Amorphotheca resinae ATCC 22711]|uniref:Uncharacterized protein n=1 Tax=Amorphotheca resinae ATCC 22711 TaxID=857342 RepID=A0A2T3AVG1_AMORE|nr:hypothetical protein M430DRAFT_173729 [Amorphotheca resinae ATCC 22711]PSS12659.1 hypothetical protein M430DRAFT_173729 [Amorphotheca resinae ATCC 22711]
MCQLLSSHPRVSQSSRHPPSHPIHLSTYVPPSSFPEVWSSFYSISISISPTVKRKKKKCAILSYPLPSSPPHNTIYHIYSPILVFDHCFQILPSFQHLSYACVLYSYSYLCLCILGCVWIAFFF